MMLFIILFTLEDFCSFPLFPSLYSPLLLQNLSALCSPVRIKRQTEKIKIRMERKIRQELKMSIKGTVSSDASAASCYNEEPLRRSDMKGSRG